MDKFIVPLNPQSEIPIPKSPSPPVIGRMTFSYRDERAATGGRDLSVGLQRRLDHRSIVGRFRNARSKPHFGVERCRPEQPDVKFGGHRAWWRFRPRLRHQVPGSGPVAVTVEQRATDPAIHHPRKRFVMRLGAPGGNNLVAFDEALDPQSLVIRGTASEAAVVGRVSILKTRAHMPIVMQRGRSSHDEPMPRDRRKERGERKPPGIGFLSLASLAPRLALH